MKRIRFLFAAGMIMLMPMLLGSCAENLRAAVVDRINAVTAVPQTQSESKPSSGMPQPSGNGYCDTITYAV